MTAKTETSAIISPEELAQLLKNDKAKILDATYVLPGADFDPKKVFKKERIAAAQFFDLKGEQAVRMSSGSNITMRNIRLDCTNFFNVTLPDSTVSASGFKYTLSNFTFENLEITAKNPKLETSHVKNFKLKDVSVNGKKVY